MTEWRFRSQKQVVEDQVDLFTLWLRDRYLSDYCLVGSCRSSTGLRLKTIVPLFCAKTVYER